MQPPKSRFTDLLTDFADGVLLCKLAKVLSGKPIKHSSVSNNTRSANQHSLSSKHTEPLEPARQGEHIRVGKPTPHS